MYHHLVLEAADVSVKDIKSELDLPVMAAQGFVTKNTEALFSGEVANLGDKRERKVAAESCLLLLSLLCIRRKRKRA